MGSEIGGWPTDRPREIRVDVVGTEAVERVEVFRDLSIVHTETPNAVSVALTWVDDTPLVGSVLYRVRVRQIDGELAWSSPIWVDAEP